MLRDDAQFRVIGEAGDGAECLDVLRAVRPDVLILAVNMPGGGPDVATAARNIRPALQILVLSGNAARRDQQRMLHAGADDYAVKTGRIKPLRAGLSGPPPDCTVIHPDNEVGPYWQHPGLWRR